jgi:hypothetical protein
MRIVIECHLWVCVPKLALRDLGSCARFKQNRRVHVTKRVETCTGNLQRIAQRPQPFLNDFSRRCSTCFGVGAHPSRCPRCGQQYSRDSCNVSPGSGAGDGNVLLGGSLARLSLYRSTPEQLVTYENTFDLSARNCSDALQDGKSRRVCSGQG